LTDVFVAEGSPAGEAACLAAGMIADGTDSQLVYARLGVQQPEYLDLRRRLERGCATG